MRERKIEKSDHSRSIENANNNNHRIRHVHFIVFTTNQLCVVFGSVCSLFTFAYLVSVSLQLEALSMWLSLCTERSTACVDVCAVGLFVWDRSCLCLCPFRSFQFSSVNSCAEFISVCSATIYSMCIVYACFRFAFMHLAQFADAIFWSIATCMMNGRPSKRKNAKSCGHRWSSSECSKLIWAIYKVTRSARVDHFAQANAFFFIRQLQRSLNFTLSLLIAVLGALIWLALMRCMDETLVWQAIQIENCCFAEVSFGSTLVLWLHTLHSVCLCVYCICDIVYAFQPIWNALHLKSNDDDVRIV